MLLLVLAERSRVGGSSMEDCRALVLTIGCCGLLFVLLPPECLYLGKDRGNVNWSDKGRAFD